MDPTELQMILDALTSMADGASYLFIMYLVFNNIHIPFVTAGFIAVIVCAYKLLRREQDR